MEDDLVAAEGDKATVLRRPRNCYFAAAAALLVVILGILLSTAGYSYVSDALRSGLRAHYVLDSPNAGDYYKWLSSDTPGAAVIYTAFYVYNITNPWDVVHNGAKPIVQEIGPLTYRYKQTKANVTWDDGEDNDVVTYNQWQYYVADDDATRALENATICSVYLPLLGALKNPLARLVIQLMPEYASPDALWTNRSIYEVIWGWEDPLLAILAKAEPGLPTRYPGLQSNDTSMAESVALHGPQRMYTGALTAELARELITWDGMDDMMCCPYGPCGDTTAGANSSETAAVAPWHTPAATQIQGSFGDQFHQFLTTNDVLRVASYGFGIYRHWELGYTGQYSVEGVNLYKFQLLPGTLGNDTTAPAEALAYDGHGPAGLLNLTACYWGAPIYLSKPLFLDGTPSLHDGVIGLGAPDRSRHDTWLGVEPTAGETLDFHWRVGVNADLFPIPGDAGFVFFPNLKPVFLPLIWADRYGTADSGQITEFTSRVYFAQNIMYGLRYGGIATAVTGGVALLVFLGFAWWRRRQREVAKDAELAYYIGLLASYDAEASAEAAAVVSHGGAVANGGPDVLGAARSSGPGRPQ